MTAVTDDLQEWLRHLVERHGAEEDAYAILARRLTIELAKRTLRLEFGVEPVAGSDATTEWACEASGLLEWRVDRCGYGLWMERVDDHPLLWEFQQAGASLYFQGEVDDAAAAEAELRAAHFNAVRGWIPFDRFVNRPGEALPALSGRRYGLLACGPCGLIDRYAAVLGQHGLVEQVRRDERPAGRHDWRPGEPVPVCLLLDERHYVVAKQLVIRRLPAGTGG